MNKEVVITGYSNLTSEGLTLHLNRLGKLKNGNIHGNEFWVSWDKIGESLFENYCSDYDKSKDLRKESIK